MKNAMRIAQGEIAPQIDAAGIATSPSSLQRIGMVSALVIASALTLMGTDANAQMSANDSRTLSNAAQQAAQRVGYEAARTSSNANLANETAKILGLGANTLVKLMTGQSVNASEVAGTGGQVLGAVAGYKMGGDTRVGKAAGAILGGAGGTVAGRMIGSAIDENSRIQEQDRLNAPVATNASDQAAFIQGMRYAAEDRSFKGQAAYQRQVAYTPAHGNPVAIDARRAGFSGYVAEVFNKSGLKLVSSGQSEPPEYAMLSVANKGMELVKVGKAYGEAVQAWDRAFMVGATADMKNQIHVAVVNTNELFKAKAFDYAQVRNSAAVQGFDVSMMDGSVARQLESLKPQTNYSFQTSYRSPSPR